MFGVEFYPTPAHIARQMADMLAMEGVESVLEPGGGKGDLCRAVARRMNFARSRYSKNEDYEGLDIDVCEIDRNLRHILKGQGLRVVHDDFLTFSTCKQYDAILMNPPFSQGARHLHKALDMIADGGQVVCLLNAETLRSPSTNERKDLVRRLEELQAKIQFEAGAFARAEKPADVDIAIVYVHIERKKKPSALFEQLKRARDEAEPQDARYTALIQNDFVRGIVQQYELEVQAGAAIIREFEALRPLTLSSFEKNTSALALSVDGHPATVNRYIRQMRRKYWAELFHSRDFAGCLTTNLLWEYEQRIEELADYDFSLYNIYTLRIEMAEKLGRAIEDTILDLFEDFSNKYAYTEYSKNIHYYNGWKTNKAWKVNRRIVYRLSGYDNIWGYRPDNYSVVQKLEDIEKVFNYLDGGNTADVSLKARLERARVHGVSHKISLKYFTITFYKKGTAHIEFTSDQLLKKFNIFGSQKKGWLPPSYGKTHWRDMSAEEQAVAQSFDGSSSEYEKTVQQAAYYLFSAKSALALPSAQQDESKTA